MHTKKLNFMDKTGFILIFCQAVVYMRYRKTIEYKKRPIEDTKIEEPIEDVKYQ